MARHRRPGCSGPYNAAVVDRSHEVERTGTFRTRHRAKFANGFGDESRDVDAADDARSKRTARVDRSRLASFVGRNTQPGSRRDRAT
jgi:hypothetical protein